MKTVSYLRNSTNLQKNSIDMQRDTILTRSIEHLLPIDEEYLDEDISARKLSINQRPALKKLLDDIENDNVQTLFVYKRDRLARQKEEYAKIYRLLKDKKIKVIFGASDESPIDYTDVGELFELIRACINEREGNQIIERLMQTRKTNFLSGKTVGRLPYGYKLDKDSNKIERIEHQLEIVIKLYNELLSKKHAKVRNLTKAVNEAGLTKDGKPWTAATIKNVITNPIYMGTREMNINKEKLTLEKFKHISIIDSTDWYEAQKILEEISSKTGSSNHDKKQLTFLLDGILFCKECNQLLKPNNARNLDNLKYKCSEHSHIYINKEQVEQTTIKMSLEFFKNLIKSNFTGLSQRYQKDCKIALEQEIKQLNQQIDSIQNLLVQHTEKWLEANNKSKKDQIMSDLIKKHDKYTDELYRKENIYSEISELVEMVKKISDYHKELPNFEKLDTEVQQFLLKDIIYKITVSSSSFHIVFKHPFFEAKEAFNNVP
ncbi:recombinase family protein [Desulfuribacillus alkaliarsenatis]|uniref:Uncharacterized protein n=1 Tax=Desulfuribacillus alkaliarsenatis TaxID=766136 RepID=A0A1E5G3X0_9FIRM|nr:recombinase family protein [Desulfuribacillus alkaliarsenatis]OEF97775.1 hypothetical protein BHF68_13885 [Desulfuribacillus alkaliarsenatis]